jgi:hypothetical protein
MTPTLTPTDKPGHSTVFCLLRQRFYCVLYGNCMVRINSRTVYVEYCTYVQKNLRLPGCAHFRFSHHAVLIHLVVYNLSLLLRQH